MFIDLVAPFELGQKFDLTLKFESGAEKTVTVEVTEEDPNA
jgi:copper(I)-binding protein